MSGIGHNRPPAFTGESGWVRIDRAIRAHWLVGFGQPVPPADPDRGSHSRSEAFVDLIMECRYEAGTVNNGGRKMILYAGELVGAVSWLASRWNWTPKTVRGFLDRLEADGMIRRIHRNPDGDDVGTDRGNHQGKQAAVLSICNFETYQLVADTEGQAQRQAKGKQGASKGQAEGNNTKDNKGTREQEEDIDSSKSRDPDPLAGKAVDRAAINRDAAKAAFAKWQDVARECGLPVPRDTTFPVVGKKIASRMYEHAAAPKGAAEMLAIWDLALANVQRSGFLRGQTQAGFRADLKFLCQRESFAKLIDGGYGNGAHAPAARNDFTAIVGREALAHGPLRIRDGDGDLLAEPTQQRRRTP